MAGGDFDIKIKGGTEVAALVEQICAQHVERAKVAMVAEAGTAALESTRRAPYDTHAMQSSVFIRWGTRFARDAVTGKRSRVPALVIGYSISYAAYVHFQKFSKRGKPIVRKHGEILFLTKALRAISRGLIGRVAAAARVG